MIAHLQLTAPPNDGGTGIVFLWEDFDGGGRSKQGTPFYFLPDSRQVEIIAGIANEWLARRD